MSSPFELRVKFGKKGEAKLLRLSIMDDIFEETFNTSLRLELGIAEDELPGSVFRMSSEAEESTIWHHKGTHIYRVLKSYVARGALPDPAMLQPLLIVPVRTPLQVTTGSTWTTGATVQVIHVTLPHQVDRTM